LFKKCYEIHKKEKKNILGAVSEILNTDFLLIAKIKMLRIKLELEFFLCKK